MRINSNALILIKNFLSKYYEKNIYLVSGTYIKWVFKIKMTGRLQVFFLLLFLFFLTDNIKEKKAKLIEK